MASVDCQGVRPSRAICSGLRSRRPRLRGRPPLPLGPADGPTKTAVFGGNTARLYNFDKRAELAEPDRFAAIKADYLRNGPGRSNLRYGYVRNAG